MTELELYQKLYEYYKKHVDKNTIHNHCFCAAIYIITGYYPIDAWFDAEYKTHWEAIAPVLYAHRTKPGRMFWYEITNPRPRARVLKKVIALMKKNNSTGINIPCREKDERDGGQLRMITWQLY